MDVSKEEKEEQKKLRDDAEKKYKTAIVDGKEQPVGNFRIEPPGIFIGRGCHPKMGKIKKRILPEDITINIGKEAKIPETLPGHKWGEVIHEKSVEWLASWKDPISSKLKYVWLGGHSDFKTNSDIAKFDVARKLKRKIKQIREDNDINLASEDPKTRQIATALYFIDNLALRVGNEKDSDEADTVGVTSLRIEHVTLKEQHEIALDFLGKDSIRYKNSFYVTPQVYKNVKEFMSNREEDDNLFDMINPSDLNKYLQSFIKGLTAKVFRTYNASNLFQKELLKITKKFDNYDKDDKINVLLDNFNKANAKVAALCNHQKNVSKTFNTQLDKLNETIKKAKSSLKKTKSSKGQNKQTKIEKAQEKIKQLKAKKELKIEMKNVSLGTSKINYIDPRITIAFLKKHDLPIDTVFSKTLQEKFKWAFDVDADFKF
jgi:DNA topoisomerase-1